MCIYTLHVDILYIFLNENVIFPVHKSILLIILHLQSIKKDIKKLLRNQEFRYVFYYDIF